MMHIATRRLCTGIRTAALIVFSSLALSGAAYAYTSSAGPAGKRQAAAQRVPAAAPARTSAPVVTVQKTAPGQAGYVHYFLITGPDGERETQVGLELAGDRIAWSFPNGGVGVSPFIASGEVVSNGETYAIEHLYGIRPFPDSKSMSALARELDARVAWWLGQKTPYCDEENPTHDVCVSCLGFVLRVLYPGASPEELALPLDFKSARKDAYTTEDFLMYLAGVRLDATRQARLKRIRTLKLPGSMREELVRIANAGGTTTLARTKARTNARSTRRSAPRRGS